ncbi:ComEC/Rec2 family competence protein [Christiangramia sediminis]|uniref:ComEC family competence protein n=1 Tax=Christiangramia sediminis TaxID=2881336 RepID=A0A9X1LJJ5_9FLAO|nr:ComEC/Rec2 family competence protein [Christiangramia sediminis]MCB7481517.1 ComEC family competence protein [Christiangramia sediminis]
MKDFRFIFLRLSFYLILGILAAFNFSVPTEILIISGILIFCLFLIAYFRANRNIFPDALFGITAFLLIFYLGFSATYFNIPENQKEHFINLDSKELPDPIVSARISEELKPTAFSQRFVINAERIIGRKEKLKVKGKVLLNLSPDSTRTTILKPGMQVLVPWSPQEIKEPLNPFQFSYKDYLNELNIKRQLNIQTSELEISNIERHDLQSRSWQLREQLISDLKKYDFGENEIAIFQALILGQRREISNTLYKNYAAAGAIHILAISGLHIGILLIILNFLFRALDRIKYGKLIKAIILILLLWSFAVLTGLSASVVRAVTMFSFIAIGLQLKRKTSALNSLFLSLFILLLINPHYIFQVGFQLSYLAVFSIIVFQPLISGLFQSKIKPVDYLWKLSSVSIAAQIGVIPLSLYYFHQFPGLFLLTNLIILPFLGLLLAYGIIVILLAAINSLPPFIAELFDLILRLMNGFIEWIAGVESFVFSNIHLSLFQTLSLYLIILAILLLLRSPDYKRIYFFLISILVFQLSTFYFRKNIPASEAIIFHKSRQTIIGVKNDQNLSLYSEENLDPDFIADYVRERKLGKVKTKKIPQIMDLSTKLSLIIDTTKNYQLSNFNPEIIILRNSPKINLERIIDQLSPKEIVADGSNYNYLVKRWQETAGNKKIPFHHTGEKGAYFIKPGK